MSSEMAMKIILYFSFICFVLGMPFITIQQKTSTFPPEIANSHPKESKIPLYMVHLYQTLSGKSKDLQRPEDQILEESDTVQSLSAKNCTVKDNRWSLTFDLSPILRTEELRLVEVRIHLPSFMKSSNVTLEVYHTTKSLDKLFLGSVVENIPAKQYSSWKSFNVTKMVAQNLQWGNKLAIREEGVTQSKEMPEEDNTASQSEYSTAHVLPHKITTDQAFIVFFTKDTLFSKIRSSSLIKKLAANFKYMARLCSHKKSRSDKQQTEPHSTKSTTVEEQKPLCRKVDMVVDFNEIGWDNWVVYPKRYNAYQCVGTCHASFKGRSKTTNYDYIKNLVKSKGTGREECSACVPLNMRPLSMLFYEDKNLVLRHHDDMIIEDCGLN